MAPQADDIMTGAYYDPSPLAMIEAFAATLRLTKATRSGGPEPMKLLPHARRFFANVLGWKRADGTRLYRKSYWSMARKMAKTQNLALLGLYLLLFDQEAQPEVYIAATEVDQAGRCYEAARDMVLSSEEWADLLVITDYRKTITCPSNGGILRAISSKGRSKHGNNPSGIIFDELHVWGPEHQALYDAMVTGSGTRRQPLRVSITTAGHDEETICYREYSYAKRVLSGTVKDPTYYAEIYEVPKDADWTDESLWTLANPALDQIGNRQMLREECREAIASPAKQATFRQLYLNQWTPAANVWLPLHVWDQNDGAVDEAMLAAHPCYGGLDLAWVNDLTAFVLWWELKDNPSPITTRDLRYYVRPYFFLPQFDSAGNSIVERGRRAGVDYAGWERAGLLEVTEGNQTDWIHVTERIKELSRRFDIQGIAYDRAGSRDVITRIQDELTLTVEPWGQGYLDMSPPMQRLESLLVAKQVSHGGHPILRWNIECTDVATDPAGNIKPVKPGRNRIMKRIDGVVAMAMACGLQMREGSPYAQVSVSGVEAA